MRKLNNKGLTLIELIISFALVAVAIIYFYQTLYTVKKLYVNAQKGTQTFVDKDYALRLADAYLNNSPTNLFGEYYRDDKYTLKFVTSTSDYDVILNRCEAAGTNNCSPESHYIKIEKR